MTLRMTQAMGDQIEAAAHLARAREVRDNLKKYLFGEKLLVFSGL